MRYPVDPIEHTLALATAAQMLQHATEALNTRPLSDTEVAWAKGCLERGAEALGSILESVPGPRAVA